MEDQQIEFLKDQVQRLNAELAKYRYQEIQREETPLDQPGPAAPWLTEKSALAPLIEEYDQQFQKLEQEKDFLNKELSQLRPELERVVADNTKLVQQLRETIENQLGNVEDGEFSPSNDQEQVLQNLQMQAESALQEKDAALERWQEADQEIDRLQRELQNEKDSHQWKIVEEQANQMKSEYYETVSVLNKEIEALQNDLRSTRDQLDVANMEVRDLKRSNKDLEQQLVWKDQEIADVIFKEGMSDSRVGELKKIMDETSQRLSTALKELDDIKGEKIALEARVSELKKRGDELEKKEFEYVAQVRDAVQMVENSVLEKDQAEMEVKQKEEEIEKLQEALNKLINDAGVRTRQEVDSVRKQCNERISKLTVELHTLEMDNAEKEEQIKRALRDKRNVEAELERVLKEGHAQAVKDKGAYEDINRRAIQAERMRDELLVKVDNLTSMLKREEMNQEQLRSRTDKELTEMKQRKIAMDTEFEHLNEDRIKLQNEVDEMKKRVVLAEKEKESAQRKYQKEMAILENDIQQKIQDYEVRLQCSDDASRKTITELRNLLQGQQRMSARWKEECQSITEKFESKINDMRSEISHLKKRNDELTSLLRESQAKTMEAERMITDYAKNIYRIEERMRDSENRAAEASKQLARQSVRERQMASEKRSLMQELQRSTMENSFRNPEALLVSDLASSQHSGKSVNGSHVRADIQDVR
ncbi:sodium channel and clathrin linker 1-like [Saccostrea echinata]|uniref:sodium channel and clathrin linker 1-like n=1 Tax=Saccostrea echinata TaxID=191078 RepID=UPI002A81F149|nr:sodium channel and clathrin linker 1-like [Saccostrea echinata]